MILVHKFMAFLGAIYVVLIDHDGERNIRRVKWSGGVPVAERYGLGIRVVELLDDGALRNGNYVTRWEPFDPLAPKRPLPSHRLGWGRGHA